MDRHCNSYIEELRELEDDDEPNESLESKAKRTKSIQITIKRRDDRLELIENFFQKLPYNYRTITPSAIFIQNLIDLVFELLAENQLGEAYLYYLKIPKLNHFLELAFPNIEAMIVNLRGIFHLFSNFGYEVRTYPFYKPEEHILREHLLHVYQNQGRIWCATRTSPDTTVHFIIEDSDLGKEVFGIRTCLEEGKIFNSLQKNAIFDATAKRGYFPRNDDPPSAIYTLRCFESAYELIQPCNPEIAKRFYKLQLSPLETLISVGNEVKKNTPISVQRSIFRPEYAKHLKRLANKDAFPFPQQFTDEQWNALLSSTKEFQTFNSP